MRRGQGRLRGLQGLLEAVDLGLPVLGVLLGLDDLGDLVVGVLISTAFSSAMERVSAAARASDRSSGQVFASSAPSAASARFVAAASSSRGPAEPQRAVLLLLLLLGPLLLLLLLGLVGGRRHGRDRGANHQLRCAWCWSAFGAPSWILCGAAIATRRRRASCSCCTNAPCAHRAAMPGDSRILDARQTKFSRGLGR